MQDDAFARQMAYREELIETRQERVYQCHAEATASARELLAILAEELPSSAGYQVAEQTVRRPDGTAIRLDDAPPLLIAGRLVQEDFAILQRDDHIHRLMAGIICFPSNWTLTEKMRHSLARIHGPVQQVDRMMSARIERILLALRPGEPLLRTNVLIHTDPELHQPRTEGTQIALASDAPRWVRIERQTLRRLPITRAVVFAIHTYLMAAKDLPKQDYIALGKLKPELVPN